MTDLSTELAGLAAKATPGPWITAPDHIGNQDYETCIERPGNAGQIGAAIAYFHHDWETDRISWKAAQSNAALAVALRNNLPAIIAALKAAETPLGDVAGLGDRYLIRKNGYWYRPNCSGYTDSTISAGRYSLEEAERYSHPNGKDGPRDGMTVVHEDELTCPDWLAFAKQRDAITALARQLAERDAEVKRLREAVSSAIPTIEALADNDLDEPISDNGMTVGAGLQMSAPSLIFKLRAALGCDNES